MWYVICILSVFVVAYGIALQAILHPNSKLDFPLAVSIVKKAYFQIHGELFLDELEGQLLFPVTIAFNIAREHVCACARVRVCVRACVRA